VENKKSRASNRDPGFKIRAAVWLWQNVNSGQNHNTESNLIKQFGFVHRFSSKILFIKKLRLTPKAVAVRLAASSASSGNRMPILTSGTGGGLRPWPGLFLRGLFVIIHILNFIVPTVYSIINKIAILAFIFIFGAIPKSSNITIIAV